MTMEANVGDMYFLRFRDDFRIPVGAFESKKFALDLCFLWK